MPNRIENDFDSLTLAAGAVTSLSSAACLWASEHSEGSPTWRVDDFDICELGRQGAHAGQEGRQARRGAWSVSWARQKGR